ncbi:uncharacterized protein LOC111272747 isoform X1 [Varroa jacobsoni]|uniref:uncharacterized protein LOC111272747 isoform X1 n=1 Tax=Varroa jacobsoni TaxID=62625 RepID=UPI000BF89239|nr:uncharacterized protein LOC111272747 isoform X1 [Varroa jacobsoni]
MKDPKILALIFAPILLSIAWGETPRRPVFVCVEMPADANDVTPESLLKIEQALNTSGAFLTTQITRPHRIENLQNRSPNEVRPLTTSKTPSVDVQPAFQRDWPRPPIKPTERKREGRRALLNNSLTPRTVQGVSDLSPPSDTGILLHRPIGLGDLESLFQRTLIDACKSVYSDILSRSPHATPFRHRNCSVLCVYGSPPVDIPEGGMCYQQRNFVGTPGRCRNGECVISGKPFEFDFPTEQYGTSNPFSLAPYAPGFTPDVHVPQRAIKDTAERS